ncbi:MAG: Rieske (2Fe-2S) protein [Rivularia sp. (in: Bacteria)]|nr:Rieske (2Fe-2S) protein [Rivularia sp. MS3]
MKSRFPFTSFPNGWFCIAYSHELSAKQVIPLHYFDRDLVLFRSEDGIAHVLDAYCPHLGAHLGHGGQVKGEKIQCPFHGWCFDGKGQCLDIPYANKIPLKVQIQSWLVKEVNGLILVWYHTHGEKPTWEIPELPEYTCSQWTSFRTVGQWKIRSHVQDINENALDTAHLQYLHGVDSVKGKSLHKEGCILRWPCSTTSKIAADAQGSSVEVVSKIEFTFYGLGYTVQRCCTKGIIEQEFITINLNTPVDIEYVNSYLIISFKKHSEQSEISDLEAMTLQVVAMEAQKDMPILENKVYQSSPILSDGDGPIMQYRHWAQQFYLN